ncbi:MAG TPA: hypothetical protein VHT24_15105 [Pseudacidobacterium sp.]|jgi:hypothetical protein|nr:hypothetical protein [Pseudacidobacterium sp.]
MSEIVTTPISYFEVEMEYAEPDLKMWLDRANIVRAVYSALRLWDVAIDDVEIIQTGKPSEQGIKFKIPKKLSSFFFGPAYCKFTRDSTNWSVAEETIQMITAATEALLAETGAIVTKRKTVIVLHVQPKTLPFIQIIGPLVPKQLADLEIGPIKTMATVVVLEGRKITIDGSASLANGIFLRFEREFDGSITYEEIAHQLKADEDQIFATLGIIEEA